MPRHYREKVGICYGVRTRSRVNQKTGWWIRTQWVGLGFTTAKAWVRCRVSTSLFVPKGRAPQGQVTCQALTILAGNKKPFAQSGSLSVGGGN